MLESLAVALLSRGLFKLGEMAFSKMKNRSKFLQQVSDKIGANTTDEKELAKIVKEAPEEQLALLVELEHYLKIEEEVTKRLEIDNKAESWLTRHIRPLTLIFLLISFISYISSVTFLITEPHTMDLASSLANLLFLLLATSIGFYFGGRSCEKWTKLKK